MREETIARNYAAALHELGEKNDELEAYAEAFGELDAAIASDARVARFLATPKVDAERKQEVLRTALAGRVPDRFLHFVLVVLAKRRQGLLPRIRTAFDSILDERAGRVVAEVTLAREPDPETVAELTGRLSSLLGKTVVPRVLVNPAIIGGVVVRYGDRRIDGSIRRHLVALRREMMHAKLPEPPAVSA